MSRKRINAPLVVQIGNGTEGSGNRTQRTCNDLCGIFAYNRSKVLLLQVIKVRPVGKQEYCFGCVAMDIDRFPFQTQASVDAVVHDNQRAVAFVSFVEEKDSLTEERYQKMLAVGSSDGGYFIAVRREQMGKRWVEGFIRFIPPPSVPM